MGITREPQNLVLQNIDEAVRQFAYYGSYFPDNEAAQASFEHKDTVVVYLRKLINEVGDSGTRESFLFDIDPLKVVKRLDSEKRKVAQRIYGPDEENFHLNMEMFAKAKIHPYIHVLRPNYFRDLGDSRKFLARASNLDYNSFSADFGKSECYGECSNRGGVSSRITLRVVRRVIAKDDKRI